MCGPIVRENVLYSVIIKYYYLTLHTMAKDVLSNIRHEIKII